MSDAPDQSLLEVLLDSWDRNNTIVLNLLRILPEHGLEVRATESGPSIAQLFSHIHYVRLVFVDEDASEFATPLPIRRLRLHAGYVLPSSRARPMFPLPKEDGSR
jgi:hypothetical protein